MQKIFIIGLMLPLLLSAACSQAEESKAPAPSEGVKVQSFLEDTDEINRKSESVFLVEALDEKGEKIAVGSGFLMFEEDLLVTSAHVVTNAKTLRVYRAEGDFIQSVESVAVDEASDTAIFRLEKKAGAPLKPAKETVKAEPVLAMGSAEGIYNLVTAGLLSGYHSSKNVQWLVFSAPVSPGESGGALFNAEGEVIGIIVGSVKDAESMNLASPISCAVSLYEKGK